MFEITFPAFTGQKYYDTHFKYVLNIFKALDCEIQEEKRDAFIVTIDRKDFLIDYTDHNVNLDVQIPVFKFHCTSETENIFCFPPVSFTNWVDYGNLSSTMKYKANGFLSVRQRPYGNAKLRREIIKKILTDNFLNVQTGQVEQKEYWLEVNDCFLAIFVPGWNNNMLDRGQFQYMALGCCTISPLLPEILPFGKKLIPWEHYLVCKDDYSDLVDIIKFYECCREECIEIGNNAKMLFKETSTPESIGAWIGEKL